MEELIVQNYNHPCIAVWGLSNEITAASAVNEDLLENHRLLNELAQAGPPPEDHLMANVFMLETTSPHSGDPGCEQLQPLLRLVSGRIDQER